VNCLLLLILLLFSLIERIHQYIVMVEYSFVCFTRISNDLQHRLMLDIHPQWMLYISVYMHAESARFLGVLWLEDASFEYSQICSTKRIPKTYISIIY